MSFFLRPLWSPAVHTCSRSWSADPTLWIHSWSKVKVRQTFKSFPTNPLTRLKTTSSSDINGHLIILLPKQRKRAPFCYFWEKKAGDMVVNTIHWFRKGLRLHDNPSLRDSIQGADTLRCIYILDPWFAGSSNVGINRWR